MNTETYTISKKELAELIKDAISGSQVCEKKIVNNEVPGGSDRNRVIMEERVHGPYQMGRKWRLVIKKKFGQRYISFHTLEEAERAAQRMRLLANQDAGIPTR